MRYPEFLKKNGKIGFIAPSFGCATEPYSLLFEKAKERFRAWGYDLVEGPNCSVSLGIGKSNSPQACGREINDFFINDRSDVIISCGGGETMCEDLPYVDFDAISKAKSKWYLGYSDNTNLTFTLPVLCDTAAIYGPCVSDFGMEPLHRSVEDAFKLMTGELKSIGNYDGWEIDELKSEEDPYAPYNATEKFNMRIFKGGKELSPEKDLNDLSEKSNEISENTNDGFKPGTDSAVCFEGRLIGGCLDCLVNLIGTPFDKTKEFCEKYKEDGIIWFIESCDLNTMDCRRAIWQLEQAGWFRYVKGFLIGRPLQYYDRFIDYTIHDSYVDMLAKYDVPVLMDVDLGHLPPMMPIVSGAKAKVTATVKDQPSLKIDYDYT
ncbi:MAG: LD-carboxypeptidase [Lachnospiraceae bacterium]|nr:LD-carboxypeptidase [Lachnospiraceae bacterium]